MEFLEDYQKSICHNCQMDLGRLMQLELQPLMCYTWMMIPELLGDQEGNCESLSRPRSKRTREGFLALDVVEIGSQDLELEE